MYGKNDRNPIFSARTSRIRSNARTALFAGSNWITVLLLLYAVMLLICGFSMLLHHVFFFISRYPLPVRIEALILPTGIFLYLLLSPLIYGMLTFCYDLFRISRGEMSGRIPITVIFHCYANPRLLFRAWLLITLQILLYALPAGVIFVFFKTEAIQMVQNGIFPPTLPQILLFILAIVCFLAALSVTACFSPALFLSVAHPDMPVFICFLFSFRGMRDRTAFAVFEILKFCIASLLSIIAAAIPFFLLILPYAIFLYISFSQELLSTIS